jgi:hypothetical protein
MSVYDDNELLRDMLLVSEAMEEVEEVSANYLRQKAEKARHSARRHGIAASDLYDKASHSRSFADEDKYMHMSNMARKLQRKRLNQQSKFENAASKKDREAADNEYKKKVKADYEKIDPRYKKGLESFTDIYNSIL